MKIIHLSYVRVSSYSDPIRWLRRINFFVSILEKMSMHAKVESIHCIRYEGTLVQNEVTYTLFHNNWLESIFPFRIHRHIKSTDPDVVLIHGFSHPLQILLFQLMVAGKRRLFIQHHSELPLRHYKHTLQRLVDSFVEGYFFPTHEQAMPWVSKKQIASISKVHEVMEAPSVFTWMPRDKARDVTKAKGEKIYLWVGRLERNKDPITLVRAFVKHLEIVGGAKLYIIFQQDDLLEEVRALIKSPYKEKILLVGKVLHPQLQYWYNSADFIISSSHYEGMGVSIAEALSCGCIPILTRIPSFVKMCPSPLSSLLFDAGVVEDLQNALAKSNLIDIAEGNKVALDHYQKILSTDALVEQMMAVFTGTDK